MQNMCHKTMGRKVLLFQFHDHGVFYAFMLILVMNKLKVLSIGLILDKIQWLYWMAYFKQIIFFFPQGGKY